MKCSIIHFQTFFKPSLINKFFTKYIVLSVFVGIQCLLKSFYFYLNETYRLAPVVQEIVNELIQNSISFTLSLYLYQGDSNLAFI